MHSRANPTPPPAPPPARRSGRAPRSPPLGPLSLPTPPRRCWRVRSGEARFAQAAAGLPSSPRAGGQARPDPPGLGAGLVGGCGGAACRGVVGDELLATVRRASWGWFSLLVGLPFSANGGDAASVGDGWRGSWRRGMRAAPCRDLRQVVGAALQEVAPATVPGGGAFRRHAGGAGQGAGPSGGLLRWRVRSIRRTSPVDGWLHLPRIGLAGGRARASGVT